MNDEEWLAKQLNDFRDKFFMSSVSIITSGVDSINKVGMDVFDVIPSVESLEKTHSCDDSTIGFGSFSAPNSD